MKYMNYSSFRSGVGPLIQQLDQHRARSKKIFLCMATIGIITLIAMPWYIPYCTKKLQYFFNTVSGSQVSSGFIISLITSTTFVTCFISVVFIIVGFWLISYPVFSYRGQDRSGGLYPRDYSFQDYVYSKLLALFGNFEFATSGGVFLADMRKATIVPKYQVYTAEDYILGVMNDSTVKIAESSIARLVNRKKFEVFKGLIIIIDTSEIKVRLRRNFAGRTVLIADSQKTLEDVQVRYSGFERFDLGNAALENTFEAYTTNQAEAKILLTEDFIQGLVNLQTMISNSKLQVQHFDDKIAYAAQAVLDQIKWPFSRGADFEREYEELNEPALDLTKSDPVSTDEDAITQTVQAEFFDDKLIIMLPFHGRDLFETNSLFEPPLNEEDLLILFTLMQTVDSITKNLSTALDRQ